MAMLATALPRLFHRLLAVAALLAGCAAPEPMADDDIVASLALVSPHSPLGLNYGESATLTFAYALRGEPLAGITLHVSPDGDDAGAALSTASVVTNDRGEASALLTAGAAESAFHVVVTAPQAQDLVVDVAVSRYAFGTLLVGVDATAVAPTAVAVEAGLFTDQGCADLPPMSKLTGALRSAQQQDRQAKLLFSTLLIHDYTVVGRAYDQSGHLVALGCVGVPEELLKFAAGPPVTVPLHPVYPSPVGSFTIKSALQLQLPSQLFPGLSCRYGLAQTLLDELIAQVAPADHDVAMRLRAARAPVDPHGCRTTAGTGDAPDQNLQTLLQATAPAATLTAIAADMAAVQQAATLTSQLDIRGSASTRWVGDHTLIDVTLQSQTTPKTYSLADVPTPTVRELELSLVDGQLSVPTHALSLRLASLWRRALTDLVLRPRGVLMTLPQLWQAVLSGAHSGTASGCDAVEAVLCGKLAPPCKGTLSMPCQAATANVAVYLQEDLSDAPSDLDLRYGLSIKPDDPDDMVAARSLSMGQASGEIDVGSGTAGFTATVSGLRRAN
jgi:hypothetical protein